MNRAAIFFTKQENGEMMTDVRFDNQKLPNGSVVIGYCTRHSCTVDHESDPATIEALRYIRDVFDGKWQSDKNYNLPFKQ